MCIVAVDYDGTITANFPAARLALGALQAAGHLVIIWSSRNNSRQHGENRDALMKAMEEELRRYNIPYNYIDDGSSGKLHAQVYIDDKALRFEGDWEEIISRVY